MGDNSSGRKETRQRMNQQHLQPKKQLTQTAGWKDGKTNNRGHVSSIFCSDWYDNAQTQEKNETLNYSRLPLEKSSLHFLEGLQI